MKSPVMIKPLHLGAAAAVTAFVLAGCQRSYRPEYAPVAEYRAASDEAMERRDWPLFSALYGNGDVIAGPTNSAREYRVGEIDDANYSRRRGLAIVTEPLIALGTLVALPVSLVLDPPTEQKRYQGYAIEPTYTAAVPRSEVLEETTAGRRQLAREDAESRQARDQTDEPVPTRQRDGAPTPRDGASGGGSSGATGGGPR
jgi:hypothetical protein